MLHCSISRSAFQASFVAGHRLTQALGALATKERMMDVLEMGCERLKLFVEIGDVVSEVNPRRRSAWQMLTCCQLNEVAKAVVGITRIMFEVRCPCSSK